MSKARGFCFTDYELDIKFYDTLEGATYIIIGDEICPDTGRQHWQGYVYFKNPRSIKRVINLLRPRHVEQAKGSPKQNRTYCTKEGKIILEKGTLPQQGQRKDLEEIKEKILSGCSEEKIANDHFPTWCQYHRSLSRFRQLNTKPRHWKSRVIWLWGPTGTGKSRLANNRGAKFITYSSKSGFFDGYEGEEIVCFDDIDQFTFERQVLLNLLDRYAYRLNVKGGSVEFIAKTIYLTSNYAPDEVLKHDEALLRRVDEIYYTLDDENKIMFTFEDEKKE